MATTNLFLQKAYVSKMKDKNGNKALSSDKTRVYLFLIHDAKHILKLKTEHTVLPKQWDFKKQAVKSQVTSSVTVNESLEKFKNNILDQYNNLRNDFPEMKFDEISGNIKEFAKTGTTPIYSEKNKPFIDVYDEYINERMNQLSHRTIQKFETLKKALIDFEKEKKYPLTFDRIDLVFYDKFKTYLQSKKPVGRMKTRDEAQQKGLLNATTEKYFSNLKNFMKWSQERGYHTSTHYTKTEFEAKRQLKNEPKNKIVTLKLNELTKLYKYDFSNIERLEKVRDVFCFACFTGQRWSDIERFKKEDIRGNWWSFVSFKTGSEINVPLVGYAEPSLDILKKYDFQLPMISSQKFNTYLKEVGRVVELDRPVIIERRVGKRVVEFKNPLHEFMSSHMGRRTAVSLLLNTYHMPLHQVRDITGHSDLRTLDKYLDKDLAELEKSMAETKNISDGVLTVVKTNVG
jgi:integrase